MNDSRKQFGNEVYPPKQQESVRLVVKMHELGALPTEVELKLVLEEWLPIKSNRDGFIDQSSEET